MTRPRVSAAGGWRRPLLEGALAAAAGAGLYAGAALLERALEAGSGLSAVLEEIGKAALILAAGLLALRQAGRRCAEGRSLVRRLRLAAARGVSLALVAVAVFAAAESLAYLAAFSEAGVLERLRWSLPVHLVAALLEALGADLLAARLARFSAARRSSVGPRTSRWSLAMGWVAWLLCLGGAAAWHVAANRLAEHGIAGPALAAGALAGFGLAALLFHLFLRRAYIGGFLDAAD